MTLDVRVAARRGKWVGCLAAALVGCSATGEPIQGSRPVDAATDASVHDDGVDASPADTTPVDTSDTSDTSDTLDASTTPDTGEPGADASTDVSMPPPVDCTTGVFGPSSYTLVDFVYQTKEHDCESSLCTDFVMFDTSCTLRLQVADVTSSAALDAADCDLFTRWLTSDLLVNALRDTVTCHYGKDGPTGAPYESTTLDLADGAANKKTFNCNEEPFKSHRKCVQAFRAKYFPGK